jgi:hypothetical protein
MFEKNLGDINGVEGDFCYGFGKRSPFTFRDESSKLLLTSIGIG